jgi:hypothetical protein
MPLFFRTIFHTFKRNKSAFYINVLGLSSGFTCAVLIFLWVAEEWHVDKFHVNGERIYQVLQNIPLADGNINTSEYTPALLADALSATRPEIAEIVSIKRPDEDSNAEGILSCNGRGIKAAELFVSANFFKVFSFHLLEGDQQNLFSATNSIILSASTARRLFGTTNNVVGRSIKWDRGLGDAGIYNGIYLVAGIAADAPVYSSLKFEVLFPFSLYLKHNADDLNWQNNDPQTYLLLGAHANIPQLNLAIENVLKSQFTAGSMAQQFMGSLFIQRFADRYLNNNYENGAIAGGRITYVRFFCGLAMLIVLIACINFTNLSTAQAAKRLKEIGVKKVLGVSRRSLILQYLLESVALSFLAMLFSLLATELLLPAFSSITGKNLELVFNPLFTGLLIIITMLTGVIAGIYPALYLSGLKPITALKGKLNINPTAVWTHKGLVAIQFTVSVILILAVLVVYQQMKLVQTHYLGYNKSQVLHFANEGMRPETQQAFTVAARGLRGVAGISNMEGDLLGNHGGGGKIDWPGKLAPIEFSGLYADYNFCGNPRSSNH